MWLLQTHIHHLKPRSLQDVLDTILTMITCLCLSYAAVHMPWNGTELALELSTHTGIIAHSLRERRRELIIEREYFRYPSLLLVFPGHDCNVLREPLTCSFMGSAPCQNERRRTPVSPMVFVFGWVALSAALVFAMVCAYK